MKLNRILTDQYYFGEAWDNTTKIRNNLERLNWREFDITITIHLRVLDGIGLRKQHYKHIK